MEEESVIYTVVYQLLFQWTRKPSCDRKQTLHRKTITAQQPLDREFRKMSSLKQRMVMGGRENGEMLVKGLNISFIQVE